jgi:hypothetical protein
MVLQQYLGLRLLARVEVLGRSPNLWGGSAVALEKQGRQGH